MSNVSDRKVVHTGPEDAPIFIVGEFPGKHEDVALQPFVGPSGDFLNAALSEVGLDRSQCRLGNVLNYQPAKNDYTMANSTWQLDESRQELFTYMKTHHHPIIVPMGYKALEFFTGHDSVEKRRGSVYKYENSLVVPTIHPSAVLRDGGQTPSLLHDLAKVKRILDEGWKKPEFSFKINPSFEEMEALLPTLLEAPRLWCDIETKKFTQYIRCMGFAWSPTEAVCIFNDSYDGIGPNFKRWLQLVLENDVPKTFHNGAFDTHFLRVNGIEVRGWDYDTMLMQHSLQPELPLGLDYCTSMYTDINYYKDDGKDSTERTDKEKLGVYNCKDVVATCQVEAMQRLEADDVAWKMFRNKWAQLPVAYEFSTCGLLVDSKRRGELERHILELRGTAYTLFFGVLQLHGIAEKDYFRIAQHQKVKDFLYKTLALPVQTNQRGVVTADEDAIVSLLGTVRRKMQELKTPVARQPWELKMAALRLILELRGYEKLLSSYINITFSEDGRARSVYNITGTETNRWSASAWYDGTGLNGQTIPRVSL